MTVASRLTQGQRQTLGFRQIQAVNLLRLSNEELAADLSRRAAANPFLRLQMPQATALGEPEQAQDTQGIYAHIIGQLRLVTAARADEALALAFVEALDSNGWLDRPVAQIAVAAERRQSAAEAMLTALQQEIEPVGLFARDLADCLRLQAQDRGQLDAAMLAVLAHLDLIAAGGAAAIAKATGLPADTVEARLAQICRMDPRPGLAFGGAPALLRAPDVIVTRSAQGWQIALNRSTLPVLSLAPKEVIGPELRSVRADAEWLASIVERRNRTVLAVAKAVLDRQRGFLDRGDGALLALSRVEIAATMGLHDSTVGRVARHLLVETPHGMRTLCSLFCSGPAVEGGAAATALQHRLRQLIATENPREPLQDAELAEILRQENNPVARRTVTKYRQAMGIPTWNLRRRAPDGDQPCPA